MSFFRGDAQSLSFLFEPERKIRTLLYFCLAGLSIFLGRHAIYQLFNEMLMGPQQPRIEVQTRPIEPRGSLSSEETRSIEVFDKAAPSVVYVSTVGRVRRWDILSDTVEISKVRDGTGSGFIWDRKGHIVTNFHVVRMVYAQRRDCEVTFRDGSTFPAKIVGVAGDKDLAVLKVDMPEEKLALLKPIALGTSRDLRIGQYAYAIGNPLGLDNTMTQGIVSAVNRKITALTGREIANVIQTDAPINPGNSGGPLLDSAGRLIGVNTAIREDGQNIGFAIPVDTVSMVVPRVISNGGFRTGIGVQTLKPEIARRLGIGKGLIVAKVSRSMLNSLRNPRETEDGYLVDIILAVNDIEVVSEEQMETIFEGMQPGDTVVLTIQRGEQIVKVPVKLVIIE